ncbi:cytochrome C [Geomonas subterranea]|uniref:Cytochrome C n=1 Tax=Geomonas subterranea TaxID=2847989 RepID=A0ABX8LHT3_9BACT|nr:MULTISPECIES: cytochrome C [Geomonas]QXE90896.1 cytochrome C [Geomonas subterranea]QXM11019.1 cytochrome C [Geomonas subterranea]
MKKILVGVVALGSMTVAGVAMAGLPAATGVNGSLHDMTKVVTNADSMGRVCVFCHTPHNAQSNLGAASNAPLWNHDAGTATYTPYQWVTPLNKQDALGNSFQPQNGDEALQGPSRLCMTCHDGTIAVDQHGKAREQVGTVKMGAIGGGEGARADLGGDLTKTHPIGFDYVAIRTHRNTAAVVGDLTGTEIVDPTEKFATAVDTTGTVGGVYNVVTRAGNKRIVDVLFDSKIMTCASCHEVHNKENAVQDNYKPNSLGLSTSDAPNYFLYAKETDSLICLSCHIK